MLADTEEGTKDFAHLCLLDFIYMTDVENEDGKYLLWFNFIVCPSYVFLVVFFCLFVFLFFVFCFFFHMELYDAGYETNKITFELTIKLNHIIQCYMWSFR